VIHEEITTEIDVSKNHKLSESKVVHVDFGNEKRMASGPVTVAAPVRRESGRKAILSSIDWRLPWSVRLFAVVTVVLLSLLFF
jgi:hypothetical protein